jgi:hypothetical protein
MVGVPVRPHPDIATAHPAPLAALETDPFPPRGPDLQQAASLQKSNRGDVLERAEGKDLVSPTPIRYLKL